MSGDLHTGEPAPDFHAVAVGGEYGPGREVSLAGFRGRPLVLYFYPKDDTPGCTVQACELRDAWDEIKKRAPVLGVSVDSAERHQKFIKKFQLPFPLLSDPDHKVVTDYGVWVKKQFMGRKYMGVERTTFVIDDHGRISAILRKVKPEQHVDLLRKTLPVEKR